MCYNFQHQISTNPCCPEDTCQRSFWSHLQWKQMSIKKISQKWQKWILQVTHQGVSCFLHGLLPLAAAKSMQQSQKDDHVRKWHLGLPASRQKPISMHLIPTLLPCSEHAPVKWHQQDFQRHLSIRVNHKRARNTRNYPILLGTTAQQWQHQEDHALQGINDKLTFVLSLTCVCKVHQKWK